MERNVQITVLALLISGLFLSGCKREELSEPYDLTVRIEQFFDVQEPEVSRAFAEELSVVTGGDDSEEGLTAQAAGVFACSGGDALFHKNVGNRMNPASTTKVMTCLLALKYGNLADMVTVTDAVIITEPGSTMANVNPGDVILMEDLLYGLMMPSGNDAANAIAVHMAGSIEAFVQMMNEEAQKLGATGTHFANANGLTDPDHYTTAYDLYLIFNEALKYDKFRDIIGAKEHAAVLTDKDGAEKTLSWTVGNYYLNGKAEAPAGLTVFGGKTGTTQAAGYCLVMGSVTDGGEEYISVIMDADSRSALYDDMTKIISKIVN